MRMRDVSFLLHFVLWFNKKILFHLITKSILSLFLEFSTTFRFLTLGVH